MTEFKKYKLGDICDLNKNSLKVSDTFDTIEYLDTSSITENTIDSFQNFSREDAPSRAQRKVQNETIIFSTVRPNQNHFGLIQNPKTNLIVSSGFTTLDVKDKIEFDAKYLYYNLTQPSVVNFLQTLAQNSVSAYPSINPDDIGNLYLRFPEVSTQKKIASVLSNIDRKISANREINRNLEELAKQIYDYWFVQFDFPNEEGKPYKSSGGKMVYNEILKREIPADWEVKNVVDVIEPIERGISYTSDDIKSNKGIPMLNLACYDKQGEYRSGEMKFFSGKCTDRVYPFEMFIACTDMTQNADIIGRPIFAPTEYNEYVYSMDLAKITPKLISKMYLYYTLRTSFYHTYIKPFASGTNVKHLNIDGIERYPLYIPSGDIQKRFEERIRPIKIKQQKCLQEIQELAELRDSLLPLLMNGQVTLNSCLSAD